MKAMEAMAHWVRWSTWWFTIFFSDVPIWHIQSPEGTLISPVISRVSRLSPVIIWIISHLVLSSILFPARNHYIPPFIIDFPSFPHDFPMIFHISHDFPMVFHISHDLPMIFPWFSHDFRRLRPFCRRACTWQPTQDGFSGRRHLWSSQSWKG